jgi:hypothetical protein
MAIAELHLARRISSARSEGGQEVPVGPFASVAGVTFFDPGFPEQALAQFDPEARRGLAPGGFGVVAAGPVVLAVSESAAVGVEAVMAFPDALRFDLVAMLREPIVEEPDHKTWSSTCPVFHCMWPAYDPGPGFVRFGVRFADGSRFDNLSHGGGFGSSGPTYGQAEFWVPEIPGPGPVALFVQWQAVGIPESVTYVDGESIREAVAKSVPLWS